MTLSKYTFYLEFGNEKLVGEIEIDNLTTSEEIQRIYDEWRDNLLICGWWKKENDAKAFKIIEKLTKVMEEHRDEQS